VHTIKPTGIRGAARIAAPILISAMVAASVSGQGVSPRAGLWVGDARLAAVSDANPLVPDLSFDLGVDGLLTEETLVPAGAAWRYLDTGADLGTAWREKAFVDAGWKTGSGSFGYGDGAAGTALLSNSSPTIYFRTAVVLSDPARYSSLKCRLLRDDAAVVYLNGAQIRRSNLGSIYNCGSLALSRIEGAGETAYEEFVIPANLLQATNVVAVELHQFAAWDPDAHFAFEMTAVVAVPVPVMLHPVRSTWTYDDSGADRGTAWRQPVYDDSMWKNGSAPLGYGNSTNQNVTRLEAGEATNKNPAVYFRTSFIVSDPAAYSRLDLYLVRDDGAVVYINGVEVLRSNMPQEGDIAFDTDPVSSVTAADELTYTKHTIPSAPLVSGTNVIAVEVHQRKGERGEVGVAETTTPAVFTLRLLVHVDSGGTARLLKEVTQLWKDGTYRNVDGGKEVDQPGRYVLVTDDSRLSEFTGAGLIDGEGVGRRLSSPAFDFEEQYLPFAGVMDPGHNLDLSFTLPADFRTNPFKHKYHPDHQAGLAVTRAISLSFSGRYPSDERLPESDPPPGWGQSTLGGTYHETLTGLHKNALSVSGPFELKRVSTTDRLND
jgi:hypothetical protein